MGVRQVIAGHYTATYGGVNLEYTRKGWTLHFTTHGEKVDESDAYGRTLLDILYQGANVEIEASLRVFQNALVAFWPWAPALGGVSTTAFPHGRRATDVAAALALTAVAATPAAVAAAPASATATLAILAPEQDHALLFSSQARDVPIRFVSLPAVTSPSDQIVSKLTLT